jgi:hypothetical protein
MHPSASVGIPSPQGFRVCLMRLRVLLLLLILTGVDYAFWRWGLSSGGSGMAVAAGLALLPLLLATLWTAALVGGALFSRIARRPAQVPATAGRRRTRAGSPRGRRRRRGDAARHREPPSDRLAA